MTNNWKNCSVFFPQLWKKWNNIQLKATSSAESDLSNTQTKRQIKICVVQHP
jgi:hypothetical protein